MPYNANIPQPTDQIAVSQGDLLNNFMALAPFGGGFAQLNPLGAAPAQTAMQVDLYAATSTFSNQIELFFQRQLGSTYSAFVQNYEFTFFDLQTSTIGGVTATQLTLRLACGILVKAGLVTPLLTTTTVVYPTLTLAANPLPAFNFVLGTFLSPVSPTNNAFDLNVTTQNLTNVVVNNMGAIIATDKFMYISIGY